MSTLALIKELVGRIEQAQGDKPQTHHVASELRDAVARLIHQTQPGVGDFKWSAKAVKALTKPAARKGGKPSIIVSRSETTPGETWHTDGHYLKLGDVPKRFGDCEEQLIPMSGIAQVVTGNCGGETVTVKGNRDVPGKDELVLSNGAFVDRLYLAYTMAGFIDVTLTSKGLESAVCIHQSGVCVGLVTPIRQGAN